MTERENIRWQIASSALQGILEGGKLGELMELTPDLVAKHAVRLADALMKELNI